MTTSTGTKPQNLINSSDSVGEGGEGGNEIDFSQTNEFTKGAKKISRSVTRPPLKDFGFNKKGKRMARTRVREEDIERVLTRSKRLKRTKGEKLLLLHLPPEIFRIIAFNFSIKDFGSFLLTCKVANDCCDVPDVHRELAVSRFGKGFLDSVYTKVRASVAWKVKIKQQLTGSTEVATVVPHNQAKIEDYGVIMRWKGPDTSTYHLPVGTHYLGDMLVMDMWKKENYISTGLSKDQLPLPLTPQSGGGPCKSTSASFPILPDFLLDPAASPLIGKNVGQNGRGLKIADLKRLKNLKAKAIKEAYAGRPSGFHSPTPPASARLHLKSLLDAMVSLDFEMYMDYLEEGGPVDDIHISFIDYNTGKTISIGNIGADFDSMEGYELDYFSCCYGSWGEYGGELPSFHNGHPHDGIGPTCVQPNMKIEYVVEDGEVLCKHTVDMGWIQVTEWDILEPGDNQIANTLRVLFAVAK